MLARAGMSESERKQLAAEEQKVKEYNLDYAQLHGDENPEFCTKIKACIPVIKVFRVKDQLDMNFLNSFDYLCWKNNSKNWK